MPDRAEPADQPLEPATGPLNTRYLPGQLNDWRNPANASPSAAPEPQSSGAPIEPLPADDTARIEARRAFELWDAAHPAALRAETWFAGYDEGRADEAQKAEAALDGPFAEMAEGKDIEDLKVLLGASLGQRRGWRARALKAEASLAALKEAARRVRRLLRESQVAHREGDNLGSARLWSEYEAARAVFEGMISDEAPRNDQMSSERSRPGDPGDPNPLNPVGEG